MTLELLPTKTPLWYPPISMDAIGSAALEKSKSKKKLFSRQLSVRLELADGNTVSSGLNLMVVDGG
jgi:hypothetical protein